MSKKLITTLLSLALMLALSSWGPAFADTPTESEANLAVQSNGSAEEPLSDEITGESQSDSASTTQSVESNEVQITEAAGDAEDDPAEAEDLKTQAASDAAAKKAAAKEAAAEKYKKGLASYIRSRNSNLSKSWSLTLAGYFIDAGEKYDLDPVVLMAIAQRESNFRAKVTNPYGIKGMMQTSDALARQYGYKPSSLYKAKVSIDVGARYLSSAKKKFGTYTKALSSYVYGSYAVSKGTYSKSHANSMLKTRKEINAYLKKNNFV